MDPYAQATKLQLSHYLILLGSAPISQTTCSSQRYNYYGLAAYGLVPSNATDRYGDTLGGFGSAVTFYQSAWNKGQDGSYDGIIWAMPDRGWNTNGTLNYQSRIHKFSIHLDPAPNASGSDPSPPNMHLAYIDSIRRYADAIGFISLDGFPHLPQATYNGDGFGGPGLTNRRVTLDCEGLVVDSDGDFWIPDKYGPYIYRFSKYGKMLLAITPPPAFLPLRNGIVSFSGAEPPTFEPDQVPSHPDPTAGRANNQGLEGLTISPDGRFLYVMMQSAMNQEGGPKKKSRRQTRLLEYDISDKKSPVLMWLHCLFMTMDPKPPGSRKSIGFPMDRARDSGFGRGADKTESEYRHFDVISTAEATNFAHGKWDSVNGSIANTKGLLNPNITAAT
ncbi:hypothetical protein N7471_006752 [Penicillium samsonianum]|uniref:uncharacterized protein n=1 Tax=Penicillium samsonianum TaxID=1882272 RepID=UPI002547CFB4|nr:uncharacterized protein N7471_006752 [Penicillium samsonianum]KAJ6140266.1 hypothetical protein N7471_006752 [Penicillium samsonianum]